MNIPISPHTGGVIFASLGALGVVLALFLFVRQIKRSKTTLSVEGIVVENIVEQSEDTSDPNLPTMVSTYFPKVRFRSASGAEITFKSSSGSSSTVYETGSKVPVRFDPNQPGSAEIDGFWQNWLPSLAVGVVSLAFAIIGIAIIANSAIR